MSKTFAKSVLISHNGEKVADSNVLCLLSQYHVSDLDPPGIVSCALAASSWFSIRDYTNNSGVYFSSELKFKKPFFVVAGEVAEIKYAVNIE